MCLVGERERLGVKGIEREREKEREGKAKDGDKKSWERRNSNDEQGGGEVETGRYRTEVGKNHF